MREKNKIKKSISLVVSLSFVFQPYVVLADGIKVDVNAPKNHQASLVRSHDGTTVVNIVTPNKNGISHNTFFDFNVPKKGVILNNANTNTNTNLAGWISKNTNIKNSPASTILNEVSGMDKTKIDGYMEVAGKSADVIVSNPNGIVVNGGGFINTPRATLTTGKVSFDGSKAEYDVRGGEISINKDGLNAKESSYLDIYTNALHINSKLYANDLSIVTGNNKIDKNGKITAQKGAKNSSKFSIDSSKLGGIYANSISIVGTQKGVGVNLPPEILAQDSLSINSDGEIIIQKAKVKNKAKLNSKNGDVNINKGLYASDISLKSGKDIYINGDTGAKNSINIDGKNLYNSATLAAGVDERFVQLNDGKLHINISKLMENKGIVFSSKEIDIIVDSLVNDSEISSDNLNIKAKTSIDNRAKITANKANINGLATLKNSGEIVSNDELLIDLNKIENSGDIKALAKLVIKVREDVINKDATISSAGALSLYAKTLENVNGVIHSAKEMVIEVSNSIKNYIDSILSSDEKATISAKNNIDNNGLISAQKLDITAKNITNKGAITSKDALNIKATNLTNQSTIFSGSDMYLYISNTLENISNYISGIFNSAVIHSEDKLTIAADKSGGKTVSITNKSAKIESVGDMDLSYKTLVNQRLNGNIEKGVASIDVDTLKLDRLSGNYYSPKDKDIADAETAVINELFASSNVETVEVEMVDSYVNDDYGYGYISKGFKINGKFYSKNSKLIKFEKLTDKTWENGDYGFRMVPAKYRVKYVGDIESFHNKVINKLNQKYQKFGINVSYQKAHPNNIWDGIEAGYITDVQRNAKHERSRTLTSKVTKEGYIGNVGDNPALISSGAKMTMSGDKLDNQYSTISSVGDMTLDVNEINNREITIYEKSQVNDMANYKKNHLIKKDSKWSKDYGIKIKDTKIIDIKGSSIISAGKISIKGNRVINGAKSYANVAKVKNKTFDTSGYKKIGDIQTFDPTAKKISLPTAKYGVFITSKNPTGPLIQSNPLYTQYDNYIGSEYMMDLLDYDASLGTRRLGDAAYETELVRDAIMLMTGQRFLDGVKSDNAQYIKLMDGSIEVAKKLGLKVGKKLTKAQLKKLNKDIVWLEEKVVSGKKVLVPVVYLAHQYTKVDGAHIGAKNLTTNLNKEFVNNSNINVKENINIKADSFTNNKGNINSGELTKIETTNDIKNLSGTIKAGEFYAKSSDGSIVNKTLTYKHNNKTDIADNTYTSIDETALIETTKGGMLLDANNRIDVEGAKLKSKDFALLKANEVNIKTIKDESTNNKDHGKKGYEKSSSITHIQSKITTDGELSLKAKNDVNLQAVDIDAKDTYIEAENKVNITSVVDSKESESLSKSKSLFSKKSKYDYELNQQVQSTDIDTQNLVIKGKNGVNANSMNANVDAMLIKSEEGKVDMSATKYVKASVHEKKKSTLGLFKSSSKDSVKEELLANSSTVAKNNIVIDGKNIDLTATSLNSKNGDINLIAEEKVNIMAGLESKMEEHFKSKSGLGQGGHLYQAKSDGVKTYDQNAKGSNVDATGNLIIKAKEASIAGSNIKADNLDIHTADGNIFIKEVKEKHSQVDHHEVLNVDLSKDILKGATLKKSKAEITVATATYNKNDTKKEFTTSKKSTLDIAKTLDLKSDNGDIKVVGSDLNAKDIVIEATNGNVEIIESKDKTIVESDSLKAKAKLSVAIENKAASAAILAKQLKEDKNRLENAKTALKMQNEAIEKAEEELKKGLITKEEYDEIKQAKEYYVADVAMSAKAIVDTTKALAQASTAAATSSSTGATVAGINLSASGSKSNSVNQYTTSNASSIKAKNITIKTSSDNSIDIRGSKIEADDTVKLDTGMLNITASKDTNNYQGDTKNLSASIDISNAGITSSTVSVGQSKSTAKGENYINSYIKAKNISTSSKNDTLLKGALLDGTKVEVNVGGNLDVISLQDKQNNKSYGINLSTSKDSSSLNANKNGQNYKGVNEQSKIIGNDVTLNVGLNTNLEGAVIGGSKSTIINTATLTTKDIANNTDYKKYNAGVSYNKKDSQFGHSIGLPQDISKSSITKSAIATNRVINIADDKNQIQDVSTISSDLENASGKLKKIDTSNIALREKISGKIAQEGFKYVGDYAMKKSLAGDKAWEDGGVKKTLAHAVVGGVVAKVGNGDAVSGALGAGAREGISNLTKDKSKSTQQLVSSIVGGVVGGVSGASVAKAGEDFNRQLHQREIEYLKDKKTIGDFRRYYKDITNVDISPMEAEKLLALGGISIVDKSYSDAIYDYSKKDNLRFKKDYGIDKNDAIDFAKEFIKDDFKGDSKIFLGDNGHVAKMFDVSDEERDNRYENIEGFINNSDYYAKNLNLNKNDNTSPDSYVKGALGSAVDTVKMIKDHPVEVAKEAINGVIHPIDSGQAMGKELKESLAKNELDKYVGDYDSAKKREGAIALGVVVTGLGGKGLNKLKMKEGNLHSSVSIKTDKVLPLKDRLNLFYKELSEVDKVDNPQDALSIITKVMDDVEDRHSGVAKKENPGLKYEGRMYAPRKDFTEQLPDGSFVATSKGNIVHLDTDGTIKIYTKDSNGKPDKLAFYKEGTNSDNSNYSFEVDKNVVSDLHNRVQNELTSKTKNDINDIVEVNTKDGFQYTEKVSLQLLDDNRHGFPSLIDEIGIKHGDRNILRGGDGIERVMITLPGKINGTKGQYEWIIEPNGEVNHRFFNKRVKSHNKAKKSEVKKIEPVDDMIRYHDKEFLKYMESMEENRASKTFNIDTISIDKDGSIIKPKQPNVHRVIKPEDRIGAQIHKSGQIAQYAREMRIPTSPDKRVINGKIGSKTLDIESSFWENLSEGIATVFSN